MISPAHAVQQKNDYNSIALKAQRFFDFEDWNSAVAMYELMLAQKPADINTYASACVAAGMGCDSLKQVSFMERAEKNAVPVDSLLSKVRIKATALGEPQVYEQFLYRVKMAQPWTSRMIDVRLLDYYKFRNDSKRVISTAKRLLQSTPDNEKFLSDMACAYIELGEYASSMECYKKIIDTDPENVPALLALGNYYESVKQYAIALPYLKRAYALNPTPYLKAMIERISADPLGQ